MHDVIVVGGGPTGFVTALGLAQAGVEVLLLEAEAAINDAPRAAVYHWSMLDGLERLRIREEAERTGFPKDDYLWWVRATGERIEYDLKVLNRVTRFNYNINMGQDRLAAIACSRLDALGNAEVRFGARVERISQDEDLVTLRMANGEELRARWVIGADGAGSTVRREAGLGFNGFTWPERFVATNVYHDFTEDGYWQSNMVIDDRWGAVIVKIARDGLWRCTYMEDAALPIETHAERIPEAYRQFMHGGGKYILDAASPYVMHQRCADAFRKGRILLAGDAAHVTNPTGGFGLTTGLFDAYALWPTLAAVIRAGEDEALLDQWAQERRAIFIEKTSPQACIYKDFVFHACGGGAKLEAAIEGMRAMARDPEVRLQRLMFTKGLETSSPVERTGA